MEDGEQPLGSIDLTVKFWRGLSGYHKSYAHKAKNSVIKDVMEVLDTIADEKMGMDEVEDEDDSDSSSDSDSDSDSDNEDSKKRKMLRKAGKDSSSDSDDDEHDKGPIGKLKGRATSKISGHGDGDDDGSRGLRAQVQDYKDHHKSLHRKHRGVMQWKGARTLDWMANKAKHGKGKVEGMFEHRDKEKGIETEV
jgi:hypothetical protein